MRGKRYLQNAGPLKSKSGRLAAHPLSRSRAVIARGHFDILRADALLVNLLGARTVSIGTVMEVAWAFDHRIPVVAAIEPDELNIHDHGIFMECPDFIFHSLDEAIEGVVAVVSPREKLIHTRLPAARLLRDLNLLGMQEPPETNA